MTLLSILDTFFLGPLKLLFEVIFQLVYEMLGNPGLAIVCLSLAMNFLVLPLYQRADRMQEQARDTEAALRDGVNHIKKTFTGNERMMMLQTYYRQNNYSPTQMLRGSVSLLLEIPFFMAAYQFLSHLAALQGASFGPISDLGRPDGLLRLGSLTLNLLPILMTLINFISSAIYLRGFPLKTKIQLYGIAIFFLVFLYNSPAGLLFYWTLNNVFSLFKNIFYKLKHPGKVLAWLAAVLGLGLVGLYLGANALGQPRLHRLIVLGLGLALELPLLVSLLRKPLSRLTLRRSAEKPEPAPSRKQFVIAALFLTVLVGGLIPSTYLAASPQEYVDVSKFFHPLWYLVSALCMAGGTFLLWFGVFYWLSSPRSKVRFERLLWVLCGVALVNYMFFGTKLGVISSSLQYEEGMAFSGRERLLNLLAMVAVAAVFLLVARKWNKLPRYVLTVVLIALTVMTGINAVKVRRSVAQLRVEDYQEMPHYTLSKNGRNVVFIFLDRQMGITLPYLLQERPDLQEAFDGFTYYDNVISFAERTNISSPSLLAGYEYTPVEMNRRKDERLVDKHNEALKVVPTLFQEAGYDVTVCDPTYANYYWIPDLSVFDDCPGIHTYLTEGYFEDPAMKQQFIDSNLRNFFCFSLMKTAPVELQTRMYNQGGYLAAARPSEVPTPQIIENMSVASGYKSTFMKCYAVLQNLSTMTNISEGTDNNYVFLYNSAPHEPMLLSEPSYEPAPTVDNTAFDAAHTDRFTLPDGSFIRVDNAANMAHYQVDMASLIQVANWMNALREAGVYDNTRIILVSDHGWHLDMGEQYIFSAGETGFEDVNRLAFFPLLMVKDFNSTGFTVSHEFMTLADAPLLAMEGIIENPVNPFTGKPMNDAEKYAHPQYISTSSYWDTTVNNGNVFMPYYWVSVEKDMWDPENWTFYPQISEQPPEQ